VIRVIRAGWMLSQVGFSLFLHVEMFHSRPCYFLHSDSYTTCCTVHADTQGIPRELRHSPYSGSYYNLEFEVVLLFGLTELKAQIAWKENVSARFLFYVRTKLTCCRRYQGVEKR
jgi:hypothetical protein